MVGFHLTYRCCTGATSAHCVWAWNFNFSSIINVFTVLSFQTSDAAVMWGRSSLNHTSLAVRRPLFCQQRPPGELALLVKLRLAVFLAPQPADEIIGGYYDLLEEGRMGVFYLVREINKSSQIGLSWEVRKPGLLEGFRIMTFLIRERDDSGVDCSDLQQESKWGLEQRWTLAGVCAPVAGIS